MAVATLIGLTVSFGLEVAQLATPTRVSSMLDVSLNTLSTGDGALLALGYGRVEHHWSAASWMRQAHVDPVLAILLIAWLSLHAAPFIPRSGPYCAGVSLELVRNWDWSLSGAGRWFTGCLLLAAALRVLLKRERFWRCFRLSVAGSLAAQVVFIQHHLEPDEIIGALAALPFIALFRVVQTGQTLRLVWWLAISGYALSALAPFNFSAMPQTFHWLPFTGVMDSGVQLGFFSLTGKVFVYLGLLWIASLASLSLARSTISLFLIALAPEATQMFLPGRASELSDPMLVLLPVRARTPRS